MRVIQAEGGGVSVRKWLWEGKRWLGLRDREEDFTDLVTIGGLKGREKFRKTPIWERGSYEDRLWVQF